MISGRCRRVVLAAVLSLFVATTGVSFADMVMSPYLQAVQTDSIYVLAECDSATSATVQYGTTATYGQTSATESYKTTTNQTFVHRLRLAGLSPNTLYHYRVTQGTVTSPDATFTTAATPGASFRFAWIADTRVGNAVHDAIATRVKAASPLFYLNGGDIAYDSSYAKFKAEFFIPSELALISQVPFFLATGNHETWGINTQAFTQAPASASGSQAYYSFDYGDLHVLVLNTQLPYGVGSAQYNFARRDLSSTTRRWKIATFHKPAYCSGGHGEDAGMKTITTNIFEPCKLDMAISGHSHFYQHNLVNGIHHMVLGSAGAQLYPPTNASYTIKSAKVYNYGIFDLTPTTLHLVVYNDQGGVVETIDLQKDPPHSPTKIAAPVAIHRK